MRILNYLKGHWQLIVLVGLVFVLWRYSFVWPLRMLIVFLHEASHALAAILTGGEVLNLSLSPLEGGSVLSRGGNGFIIASAGYLGSLLLGSSLFLLALRTKADRLIVALLGASMVGLSLFYVRELFPLMFCLGGAVILLLSSKFLGETINDLILRIIGLTSMVYVPYDIFSDTLARPHLRSDARILAENYGGTTLMWGVIWLIASLVFIGAVARLALKRPSNIIFKKTKTRV